LQERQALTGIPSVDSGLGVLDRSIWIARPGNVGRESGGGIVGARRRTAAGSPEFANPALQESVRAVVWPWLECTTCVTQLGTKRGSGGGYVAVLAAAAVGLRGGTSLASGVGAPRVRHKQKHLVQKDGGGLGMLTMHWIGRRVVAGRPAMRLRGGAGRSSRSSRCWASPGSWIPRKALTSIRRMF